MDDPSCQKDLTFSRWPAIPPNRPVMQEWSDLAVILHHQYRLRFVTFCHLQWYHEKIYGVVGFKPSVCWTMGKWPDSWLSAVAISTAKGYSQPSGSACSIHLPALTAAQWISKTCHHHPVISSRPPRQTSDSKNWPGNTAASTTEMVQVLALKEVTTISVNLAMKRTHIRKCCINES